MAIDPKDDTRKSNEERTPNVLPATEISRNPNPRANENISEHLERPDGTAGDTSGVGSEITDGEDA